MLDYLKREITDCKRQAHHTEHYAGSIEECEEKLMQMIAEMKEEYGG